MDTLRPIAFIAVVAFGVLTLVATSHDVEDETTEAVFMTELDYQPVDADNFNLVCTGDDLLYENVELFWPILQLNNVASVDTVGLFEIWTASGSSLTNDTLIGTFTTKIESGMSNPLVTEMDNANATGQRPPGSPAVENGGFWMGCTKSCFVRSNGGKSDSSQENVYIRHTGSQGEDISGGERDSDLHTVQCVTPP